MMKQLLFLTLLSIGSIIAMEPDQRGQKRAGDEIERTHVKKQRETELTAKEKEALEENLFLAARVGNVTAARALLKCGINVNAESSYRYTMLMFGIIHERPGIVDLALEYDADLTAQALLDGSTALHVAAADLHPHILIKLLQRGADPNAQDMNQLTPLHYVLDNNAGGNDNKFRMYNALCAYGVDETMLDASYQQKRNALLDLFHGQDGEC